MSKPRGSKSARDPSGAPEGLEARQIGDDGSVVVLSFPLARSASNLTDAERDVLRHLLDGASNARIAHARKTSKRTVANQVASIFRKLGVRSRSELVTRRDRALRA